MKHLISVVLVAVSIVLVSSQASAWQFDTTICERACTAKYGPEYTKCKDVVECKAYVDYEYKSCIKSCQKDGK